uniref:Uncharacterized protein n=1 Tax=Setaria italica TaxID=4555 RepID=K3ZXD0_SETIT
MSPHSTSTSFPSRNTLSAAAASGAEAAPEPGPEAKAAMPPRHQRKKVGRLEPEGAALMPSMNSPSLPALAGQGRLRDGGRADRPVRRAMCGARRMRCRLAAGGRGKEPRRWAGGEWRVAASASASAARIRCPALCPAGSCDSLTVTARAASRRGKPSWPEITWAGPFSFCFGVCFRC